MNQPSKWQREVICAAVVLATVAWIPSTSWAQRGVLSGFGTTLPILPPLPTGGGMPVTDASTEVNTYDTAVSLTTSVGPWYQPQVSLLGNLSQKMFSGINTQNATQLMPVTQGLPCDSYTPMTTQIAPQLMQTYWTAISNTQQLMTELSGEDFTTLAGNVQAPYELAATQANGQALLAIIQELQLERAQLGALTMVMATDKLHQLDSNVRPTMPRQGGGC